ncbi:hypothetical protein BD410DRAFT_796768 [Rickenella mellea]|uniref:F-box domain-containing protein n=1 Tax=Rickenella mellea TaxID=50990 RepID=A0A4Y7PJ53_9AGAM|nr:hypothetical protein BD410DRAFT_796768 [Rickenella mellea]
MLWRWCWPLRKRSDSSRSTNDIPQPSLSTSRYASIDAEFNDLKTAAELFDPKNDDGAQLWHKVVTLMRKRNRLAPVFTLPPDTLSQIFQHINEDIHHHRPYHWDHWRIWSKEWRNGIQICSDWRALGLNNPSLWSFVSSTYSQRKLQFYLLYSKGCQLRVRIDEPYSHEHATYLLQHPPRIKELVISGELNMWKAVLPLLTKGFPVLMDATSKLTEDRATIPLEESVLRNLSPSLRRLSLLRITDVPWTAIDLSNLLTLEIWDFSAAHFYTIIDACPNLQHINLYMHNPVPPEYSILPRRVPMPSLHSLTLSLSATFCEQVLQCLVLRDDVSLDLNCYSYPLANHTSVVPRQLLSSLPQKISLEMIVGYECSNVLVKAHNLANRKLEVNARWKFTKRNVAEARRIGITLIGPIINRSVSFMFLGICGSDPQIWVDLLTCMPQLRRF